MFYTLIQKFPILAVLLSFIFMPHRMLAGLDFDNPGLLDGLGLPEADLDNTVVNFISWVLGFFGLISLIMIIYGGFMYLTAAGSEERVDKAKTILRQAVIGMVIVMLSYVLIGFVYVTVFKLSNSPQP